MKRIFALLLITGILHPLFAGSREDLFEAVGRNDRTVIERLVRSGVSINIQDPEGKTPLIYAIEIGSNDLGRWFLQELSADADLPDNMGNTPLMTAVKSKNRNGVRMLLHAGADVDRINKNGESALSLSINEGQFIIAEDLLASGALLYKEKIDLPWLEELYRKKLRIAENRRILDTAGAGIEIFKLLVRNDYHALRTLLETGVSPNVTDSIGLTPLMYAATLDRPHLMELLFTYGADPFLRDNAGLSALDYAAYYGRVSSVDYLTTRVTWNKEELILEQNPLYFALIGNNPEIFSLLVKSGFGNGKPDRRGTSLIHYICFFGNLHAFRELNPRASLILLEDSEGRNPLFWALTGFNVTGGSDDYYAIVRLLIKSGADGRSLIALTTDQTMGEILTKREQAQPK